MMARDRNDNPHTWDWKSPDNHDLAYERERLQTIQVPPKPRGPVHVTAAYLVAYLGTFPIERKGHLMQVAEAFAPYLGLPQHEETPADMRARVERRVDEMARVLHMIEELRAIADHNKPLTVNDVIG